MTTLESVAAERGLPGTLFGYTPNDQAYWREPTLPLLGTLAQPHTWARTLQSFTHLRVEGTGMAPRFPPRTVVSMHRVTCEKDITPGIYCCQWQSADEEKHLVLARLEQVRPGYIVLKYDRHGAQVRCSLQWDNPSFRLYRAAYYGFYPIT